MSRESKWYSREKNESTTKEGSVQGTKEQKDITHNENKWQNGRSSPFLSTITLM